MMKLTGKDSRRSRGEDLDCERSRVIDLDVFICQVDVCSTVFHFAKQSRAHEAKLNKDR